MRLAPVGQAVRFHFARRKGGGTVAVGPDDVWAAVRAHTRVQIYVYEGALLLRCFRDFDSTWAVVAVAPTV